MNDCVPDFDMAEDYAIPTSSYAAAAENLNRSKKATMYVFFPFFFFFWCARDLLFIYELCDWCAKGVMIVYVLR